jgi:predicted pyridoxine 5'-phosphate oxidase superfamily flavin-nucleotide-binding protein
MEIERIGAPFHPGELRAQAHAGGGPAGMGIRAAMPDQHLAFFPLLPFLCVAVPDADGWPLAGLVQGAPGFVTAPTPTALAIGALPDANDPVGPALRTGVEVGVLGIDLGTRRRNRANGRVAVRDAAGLVVEVSQSFGNCPKYIHVRQLRGAAPRPAAVERFDGLGAAAANLVRASDTMFVATSSGLAAGRRGGMDISHRGGPAGFVRVEDGALLIPDYPGNRYFNTLGNVELDARCALVLVDFATGDVLQLQGRARVLWQAAPGADALAERFWRFDVRGGWLRRGAFGWREG